MATTECSFYTIKKDGTVSADAIFSSGGTATPISIDEDGMIYRTTHKSVSKNCYGADIPDGVGMVCVGQVMAEKFDDNGYPISIMGSYRTTNSAANDENLVSVDENDIDFYNQMFDEYFKAQVINFTVTP